MLNPETCPLIFNPNPMNNKRPKHRQFFTIEEANAMLPLVRAIVADLVQLSGEVTDRRRRLSFLLGGHNPNQHDPYQEELMQIEQELEKDTRRLHDYRDELRALGVEAENGPEGFVDFPALQEERKICYCWKLGEGEVLFWHDIHDDCTGRQLLTAGSIVESG
jgi:hypothetical protein